MPVHPFFDFYRLSPPGEVIRKRKIDISPEQIAPVVHHCSRWRGTHHGANRIIFDHNFWLMLEGEMFLTVLGETHRVGPYELIWVPPFTPHLELGGPATRAFIGVHFDLAYNVPGGKGALCDRKPYEVAFPDGVKLRRKFKLSAAHPVVSLAESLPQVMRQPTGTVAIECNAILHSILAHLLRFSSGSDGSRTRKARQNAVIARAVQYAQEHCTQNADLSVDDLAEVADLSRSRFEYLFRVETGFSPMVFIRNLRMDRAKTLLADLERSIKQVAIESGYRDIFSFSRAFKSVLGCSPSTYRERLDRKH